MAHTVLKGPYGGRRLDDGSRGSNAAELAAAAGHRTLDGARGFTGHEQLDRIGLIHMGGRVCDPRLGRFLSPDPVIGDPGRSQSWNLYSYAGNSPMSFTDPTGLVRAPLPWEDDPCGDTLGCMYFDGGGGGFGATSQPILSQEYGVSLGLASIRAPIIGRHWTGDGWNWSIGFRVIAYPVVTVTPTRLTSVSASTPGDQQPSDRPMKPGDVRVYHPDVEQQGKHHFRIRGFICSGESNPHCNEAWADKVFEHVNQRDIPYYNGTQVGNGERMLYGRNPIRHSEYPNDRRSVNETLEGHIFHSPGHENIVEHKVHFENGDLFYDVEGSGVNASPRLNNFLGPLTFTRRVRRTVNRYRNPPFVAPFEPFHP